MKLIDLHTEWLLQYAGETTVFDPALYPDVSRRVEQGQGEGYLQGVSAAVLACSRGVADWETQADPWGSLGELVTRTEAEFPGRLLYGPADLGRWRDEEKRADALCWGILGVAGFDFLVRSAADLDRIPWLFERGVRLFQPVETARSVLGGSSDDGDDRGLTDRGRAFLETLAAIPGGPRPILDLAHLNPTATSDVLAWFEADSERPRRILPVYSHGALAHDGFRSPRAITVESVRRLRALGGVIGFSVGPPFYDDPAALRAGIDAAAALPFLGRPGFEGIALGTGIFDVDRLLPELRNADAIPAWLMKTFDPPTASALIAGNARALLERALGAREVPP